MGRIRAEVVAVSGAVQAAIGLGAAFGLHLSGQQVAAIGTFSAAVLSIFVRSQVAPTTPPPGAAK